MSTPTERCLLQDFKYMCKQRKKVSDLKLSQVQEKLARLAGFDDYRDLRRSYLQDDRLLIFVSKGNKP